MDWKAADARTQRRWPAIIRQQATLAAMVAAVALPMFVLTSLTPRPLVLPLLCLIALGAAGVVALVAWWRGAFRHGERVTPFDVAGALVFIGVAAGVLSEPQHVLDLFGHTSPGK